MATVSSAAQSKSLSSTITVTGVYSYDILVGYDRTSNTATGSLSFSVSGIPAGSSINSCTLYFTYDGITTYGGVGKVNSIEYTSGSYSQNLGAVTSVTVNFSYKSSANDGGTSTNPKSSVTQTVDWTNVYITVDYTPPTAATVSNVRLDASTSNIYKGAGASATLSWDAANGMNNAISSYSIYYRDNGGAWAAYVTGVTAKSYTVAAHGTAGSNRQFYVVAIAPYGNSGNVTSPVVYSYSAVSTPSGVGISPNSVFPGNSVTLSWTASSGGVGTSVTGYQVLENGAVKTTVTGTSHTFSAPAQGSYTYKVVAVASVSGYNSAQSAGAALTVSPPASSFVLDKSTVAMDGAATTKATISPVNSAYNHDVTFALDATRTSTANVAAGSTTRTFTVPLAWCAGVTTSTSATATCTVVTKNGSTVVGQTSLTFTVTVPASVVPTVALTVAAVDGFNGLYLKGRSKCQLTAAGAGVQGSTIVSRSLSGGGYSGSVSPYTTGVLNTVGSIAMSAFVTDSRSRQSATSTQNITVLDYGSPVISAVTAFRSDSAGNALDSGEYIAVKASLTVSTVTGNSGTATVRKRVAGGTWETAVAITHNTTKILSGALVANAYEVEITLTDTVGTVTTYSTTVKPSSFMFDFRMDRAGIGRLADPSTAKTLVIPDDWKTNITLLSYPVGAIYLSTVSTSPATLFGGTWSAIAAGTFLNAYGTGYAAGGTGGAATHSHTTPSHTHTTPNHAHTTPAVALTAAQLAAHGHRQQAPGWNYSELPAVGKPVSGASGGSLDGYPMLSGAYASTGFGAVNTQNAGSGSTHAHGNTGNAAPTTNGASPSTNSSSSLPPYLTVYMWKRTA